MLMRISACPGIVTSPSYPRDPALGALHTHTHTHTHSGGVLVAVPEDASPLPHPRRTSHIRL